ncbi:MAG: selenide, water dikinase SelD [Gammaproteobacteria bacterium]|nr:selenide, water dikinase SelD [Gammaproteobacteria bacterium]
MLEQSANFESATACPVSLGEIEAKPLTSFSHGGGCGCKIDPSQLSQILANVPKSIPCPQLLVGIENSDDAAVYQISDSEALVFTNDFHTPTVDDPYVYGRAAAANALSDIYAMGGRPLMATAIAGFPVNEVPTESLQEIMRGGVEVCEEAKIALSGGHSIENPQPIFGLAAVGRVHPRRIKTNAGARPGDDVILTRPLGIGVLASAYRIDMLDEAGYKEFVAAIMHLNKQGAWLGEIDDVHALTDVTGFGLAGHLVEMARGANLIMQVRADEVPVLASALPLAEEGVFPGGAYRNMESYTGVLSFGDDWDIDRQLLFTDPQTNGGLLLCVDPSSTERVLDSLQEQGCPHAAVIGSVLPKDSTEQAHVAFVS